MSAHITRTELEVLKKVTKQESDAIKDVSKKYQPVLLSITKHYFITHFNEDDWQQEFKYIIYTSALKYDPSYGLSYGSFLKKRFEQHTINLIRKETAHKRRLNSNAISLDYLSEQDSTHIPESKKIDTVESILLKFDLEDFIPSLSKMEMHAFFNILLGSEVVFEDGPSPEMLNSTAYKQAGYRSQAKLKKYLAENNNNSDEIA